MPFAFQRAAARIRFAAASALLSCMAVHAHAMGVEVGVGSTRFIDHGDGIWYQQALPHVLRLSAPALMVGVRGKLTQRLDWHVDFLDLGHASSDSWDVMDNYYDPHNHVCLGHCAQPSHFLGNGSLWGVSTMVGMHVLGSRHLTVEAGPWLFHQSWSVIIPNFYSSTGYAPANGWAPWSSSGDAIFHAASNWGLGVSGGVVAHWHAFQATLLGLYNNHGFGLGTDPWPPIWRSELVLLVGRRF